MICAAGYADGDGFSFEIPDTTDSLVTEELVTAPVNPGEHDDGSSTIERRNQGSRTVHCQVRSPIADQDVRVYEIARDGTVSTLIDPTSNTRNLRCGTSNDAAVLWQAISAK